MTDQPLLHLEDVHVTYRNGQQEHRVLNDIDLKVSRGEFVTVVGPSGCGKSTLMRMILGSERPSSGKVTLNGETIEGPDRDRGIVFQKYSLFPHLTVRDNVAFGLDVEAFGAFGRWLQPLRYARARRQFREQAQEFLNRVGLGEHGDKHPHQLSGGMRQRVAIAQSLIKKPKILLMDEPFGALDDSTRQDMQVFILEQWQAAAMTVFFVTHDLEEACYLGSRVLVLSQYYRTDAGLGQGAKIVKDVRTPTPHPKPSAFKYGPEIAGLIQSIRREGLDPANAQHIRDFDLTHKDAFRTVTPQEWTRDQEVSP